MEDRMRAVVGQQQHGEMAALSLKVAVHVFVHASNLSGGEGDDPHVGGRGVVPQELGEGTYVWGTCASAEQLLQR